MAKEVGRPRVTTKEILQFKNIHITKKTKISPKIILLTTVLNLFATHLLVSVEIPNTTSGCF